MTNREAIALMQKDLRENWYTCDHDGIISENPMLEILELMEQAKKNPEILNEEFVAKYPIVEDEEQEVT